MNEVEDHLISLRNNVSMFGSANITYNATQASASGGVETEQLIKLIVTAVGFICSVFSAVVLRRLMTYKNMGAAFLMYVITVSDACYLLSAFLLGLERLRCGFVLYNGICQFVLYASYVLRCLSTWLLVSLAFLSSVYVSRVNTTQKQFKFLQCKVAVAWLATFAGMSFLHLTWMTGTDAGMCFPLFGLYFAALVVMEKIEAFIVIILPDIMLLVLCFLASVVYTRRYYHKRGSSEQRSVHCNAEDDALNPQDSEVGTNLTTNQNPSQSCLNGELATFQLRLPVILTVLFLAFSLPQHVTQIKVIALQFVYGDFVYSQTPEERRLHDVFHILSLSRFSLNCAAYMSFSAAFRANAKLALIPSRWTGQITGIDDVDAVSAGLGSESEVGTTMLGSDATSRDTQSASEG